MDYDDPIERRKWLARLVASAKGHARKVGRSFELTIEFIETLCAQQKESQVRGYTSKITDIDRYFESKWMLKIIDR